MRRPDYRRAFGLSIAVSRSSLVPATRLRTRLRRVHISVRRSASEGGKRDPVLQLWIPACAGMGGIKLGPQNIREFDEARHRDVDRHLGFRFAGAGPVFVRP